MRLKNVLIVVEDIKRSQSFYHELFGLEVVSDFGGNVILTEGLVLQERSLWEEQLGRQIISGDGDVELYFEERSLDCFLERLAAYPEPVRFLSRLQVNGWGKRVVRFYDPDGHVIEVAESLGRQTSAE